MLIRVNVLNSFSIKLFRLQGPRLFVKSKQAKHYIATEFPWKDGE